MKNIIITSAIFACTFLLGCTNSSNNQNSSTQTIDSVSTTETNVQKNDPFVSQDLRMYLLKGPVKSFKTTIIGADANKNAIEQPYEDFLKLEFDQNGRFVDQISEFYQLKDITQKDNDKIIAAKRNIEDFGPDVFATSQWQYNNDNTIAKLTEVGAESKSETNFFYNSNQELTKKEILSSGEGMGYKDVVTYQIVERDNYGNWTKRFATFESKTAQWDESKQDFGQYTQDETRYELQTRSIVYY